MVSAPPLRGAEVEDVVLEVIADSGLESWKQAFIFSRNIRRFEHFSLLTDKEYKDLGLCAAEVKRLRHAVVEVQRRILDRSDEPNMVFVKSDGAAAPSLPDHSHTMITKDQIKLMEFIGEGTFSVVKRGIWLNPDGRKIDVAVKILRDVSPVVMEDLQVEAGHLLKLQHPHLIRLYGVVQQPAMMVFELCEGGSLLERLRDSDKPVLLVSVLLDYCIQIVKALAYLEAKHCVHRDVAARNILLAKDEKLVKICDFGLMRNLKENEQMYVMAAQKRVPFSWNKQSFRCPPESLKQRKFSHASDVWAFGVTMWEIFTLGEEPWIGCRAIEVLKRLDAGERLDKPHHCSQQIYDLAMLCWNVKPDARPKFNTLRQFLQQASFNEAEVREPQSLRDPKALPLNTGDRVIVIENIGVTWFGQNVRTRKFGTFLRSSVFVHGKSGAHSSSVLTPQKESVARLPATVPVLKPTISSPAPYRQSSTADLGGKSHISMPIKGSFIHTGHAGHSGSASWGDPNAIDNIYLQNPIKGEPLKPGPALVVPTVFDKAGPKEFSSSQSGKGITLKRDWGEDFDEASSGVSTPKIDLPSTNRTHDFGIPLRPVSSVSPVVPPSPNFHTHTSSYPTSAASDSVPKNENRGTRGVPAMQPTRLQGPLSAPIQPSYGVHSAVSGTSFIPEKKADDRTKLPLGDGQPRAPVDMQSVPRPLPATSRATNNHTPPQLNSHFLVPVRAAPPPPSHVSHSPVTTSFDPSRTSGTASAVASARDSLHSPKPLNLSNNFGSSHTNARQSVANQLDSMLQSGHGLVMPPNYKGSSALYRSTSSAQSSRPSGPGNNHGGPGGPTPIVMAELNQRIVENRPTGAGAPSAADRRDMLTVNATGLTVQDPFAVSPEVRALMEAERYNKIIERKTQHAQPSTVSGAVPCLVPTPLPFQPPAPLGASTLPRSRASDTYRAAMAQPLVPASVAKTQMPSGMHSQPNSATQFSYPNPASRLSDLSQTTVTPISRPLAPQTTVAPIPRPLPPQTTVTSIPRPLDPQTTVTHHVPAHISPAVGAVSAPVRSTSHLPPMSVVSSTAAATTVVPRSTTPPSTVAAVQKVALPPPSTSSFNSSANKKTDTVVHRNSHIASSSSDLERRSRIDDEISAMLPTPSVLFYGGKTAVPATSDNSVALRSSSSAGTLPRAGSNVNPQEGTSRLSQVLSTSTSAPQPVFAPASLPSASHSPPFFPESSAQGPSQAKRYSYSAAPVQLSNQVLEPTRLPVTYRTPPSQQQQPNPQQMAMIGAIMNAYNSPSVPQHTPPRQVPLFALTPQRQQFSALACGPSSVREQNSSRDISIGFNGAVLSMGGVSEQSGYGRPMSISGSGATINASGTGRSEFAQEAASELSIQEILEILGKTSEPGSNGGAVVTTSSSTTVVSAPSADPAAMAQQMEVLYKEASFVDPSRCDEMVNMCGGDIAAALKNLKMEYLVEMGMTQHREQARRALDTSGWDLNRAAEELLTL